MKAPDHAAALRVLGLESGATAGQIRTAWRDLAQVWHPDRFPTQDRLREKAAEKLQEINAAYDALKDYEGAGVRARGRADAPGPQAPAQGQGPPPGPAGTSRRPSLLVLGLGKFRATGMFKREKKRWWWPW